MLTKRWLRCTGVVMLKGTSTRGLQQGVEALRGAGWSKVHEATGDDLKSVENQLAHKLTAIGVARCAQGYPQAEVLDPGAKLGGHLVRLSCPLLCQAIDEWEAEGAVKAESEMLRDSNWRRELASVNERHARTRQRLIRPEILAQAESSLGPEVTRSILESGIAGLSPEKLDDVKCIHAHVADALLAENRLGDRFLQTLNKRGCPVHEGTDFCHQHCSGTQGAWAYVPAKNKQKLWQTRQRRRALKLHQQHKRDQSRHTD